MEKICLVQGGDFVLGIPVADIIAQISLCQAEAYTPAFHLGALLSRQAAPLGQPEDPCLQVQGDEASIYLHVEQVLEQIEVSNIFSPPAASPPLFAQLCPRLTLWQGRLVFLVEPRQILPVWQALGDETLGRIKVLPQPLVEAEEQKVLCLAAPTAPLLLEVLDTAEEEEEPPQVSSPTDDVQTDPIAEEPPQAGSPADEQNQQDLIDEETFKQVMDWTIMQFKRHKGSLSLEQLPGNLAASIEAKGLNKDIIQYLIDQIVLRCQAKTSHQKRHAG